MIAVLVVSLMAVYLVVAGVVFARVKDCLGSNDADFPAFFAGILWPVVAPICFGTYLARTPERRRRVAREREAANRRDAAAREADRNRAIRELEKDNEIGRDLLPQSIASAQAAWQEARDDQLYRSPAGNFYMNGKKVL